MTQSRWRHVLGTDSRPLDLRPAPCSLCGRYSTEPVGVGEDFEYRTSPDSFLAMRCPTCDVVYLDPRPCESELERIYPDSYHAFSFSDDEFGLVYRVRSWLEARRLLRACGDLGSGHRVVDIGCGDGFHLGLLAKYAPQGTRLEGVDLDSRAVDATRRRGISCHQGRVEDLDLDPGAYDVALMIQTIEHVDDPVSIVQTAAALLKPGGRLVIVTDNTGSPDFRLFRRRHWGGYHFPRHWNLFNKFSMRQLAERAGVEIGELGTQVSPVNWVYSVRNALVDHGAPGWLVEQFSLSSAPSLGLFTVMDSGLQLFGKGALLRAILRKPG